MCVETDLQPPPKIENSFFNSLTFSLVVRWNTISPQMQTAFKWKRSYSDSFEILNSNPCSCLPVAGTASQHPHLLPPHPHRFHAPQTLPPRASPPQSQSRTPPVPAASGGGGGGGGACPPFLPYFAAWVGDLHEKNDLLLKAGGWRLEAGCWQGGGRNAHLVAFPRCHHLPAAPETRGAAA